MTADNTRWNYKMLHTGLDNLYHAHKTILSGHKSGEAQKEALRHTIEFIAYNMREMDITDNNGD